MQHLWVRAEQRAHEQRVGIMPDGVAELLAQGVQVTVEDSASRIIPTQAYADAGATIAPEGTWPNAPGGAVIFGLKELPATDTPLRHRHILFGHAYKGQPAGQVLLHRFVAGGGCLLDLEYLTDPEGRRVAAFGYWAGYAGAAVALLCWIAQQRGATCGSVSAYGSAAEMLADLQSKLVPQHGARPSALIIGALGRVGRGAGDLCTAMGVPVTRWDMAETAHGGPFPEVLQHEIFLNCILAGPGTPVFVPMSAKTADRKLSVIGDIACDPESDFSPIKVYDRVTDWTAPALRVQDVPLLDVTAIDNLPSLLPAEASEDFAEQLLPHLLSFADDPAGVWHRAEAMFRKISGALPAKP